MHGDIFQVSAHPITGFLNDGLVCPTPGVDYVSDIDDDERETAIRNLVERFPGGMFTDVTHDEGLGVNGNAVLRYNGGMEEWKEAYVKKVHELSSMLTKENCMESLSPAYHLEKLLRNPLGEGCKFTFDDADPELSLDDSRELMTLIDSLNPGDFLYVGGVLDYHV